MVSAFEPSCFCVFFPSSSFEIFGNMAHRNWSAYVRSFFLATINFSHQRDSSPRYTYSKVIVIVFVARIVLNSSSFHFIFFISISFQIMNFNKCALCLLVLIFSYSKIWIHFFVSISFCFLKTQSNAERERGRKKYRSCWPLNRFPLGRIINNKMFFEWKEEKNRETHTQRLLYRLANHRDRTKGSNRENKWASENESERQFLWIFIHTKTHYMVCNDIP